MLLDVLCVLVGKSRGNPGVCGDPSQVVLAPAPAKVCGAREGLRRLHFSEAISRGGDSGEDPRRTFSGVRPPSLSLPRPRVGFMSRSRTAPGLAPPPGAAGNHRRGRKRPALAAPPFPAAPDWAVIHPGGGPGRGGAGGAPRVRVWRTFTLRAQDRLSPWAREGRSLAQDAQRLGGT